MLVSWDIKSNERAGSSGREERRRAKRKLEMDMWRSKPNDQAIYQYESSTCIYGGILYEYPRRENMKGRSMTLI